LPSRLVTVKTSPGGLVASLWTDADKTAGIANPTLTNNAGNLAFYADPGLYSLDIEGQAFEPIVAVFPDANEIAGDIAAPETVVTASTGAAYTIDPTAGTIFDLTLTDNTAFTVDPLEDGRSFTLVLTQGGAGSFIPTWTDAVRYSTGIPPVLSTAVGLEDVLSCFVLRGAVYVFLAGVDLS